MHSYYHKPTFNEVLSCFYPDKYNRYSYLGYVDFLYEEKTQEYNIIKSFVLDVDKAIRPKWCPKWFLRLLELYKNKHCYKLHKKITRGIRITEMRTEGHNYEIVIYGIFNSEIIYKLERVREELLDETDTQI